MSIMPEFWVPALYAALVWWFATGIILLLDGLPQKTFPWSMAGSTLILLGAAYLVRTSAADSTVRGAYVAFTSAVLIWGWLEMSFLLGFITGPRRHGCIERCSGWRHFVHATLAILYNEIATALGAFGIYAATLHMANHEAFWTYVILWIMRLSAKLNLFLGVPNLGEKFLPPHLQYLKTYFARRSMNFLFPISISASTIGTAFLLQKCAAATSAFQNACYSLMASLLALAVIEHWFMVLPLPSEKLWRWASKQRTQQHEESLEQRIAMKTP
ncbi:MAG: putative photosynthetic complex assembly protein PuhE [Pseudomonadota bacterium]|nr:putative photosynthetic complex assembly protein PuhE [Pseudomonadota bacterium]